MKKILFFFFLIFCESGLKAQTGLNIGLSPGSVRNTYAFIEGNSIKDRDGAGSKYGLLLDYTLEGKHTLKSGFYRVRKTNMRIINYNGYAIVIGTRFEKVPLHYSYRLHLTKKIYARPTAGFSLTFPVKTWATEIEGQNVFVKSTRQSAINFSMDAALSVGIMFKKLGAVELTGYYDFSPWPASIIEVSTSNAKQTVFVYDTFKGIQLAYYFPMIRFKKKTEALEKE